MGRIFIEREPRETPGGRQRRLLRLDLLARLRPRELIGTPTPTYTGPVRPQFAARIGDSVDPYDGALRTSLITRARVAREARRSRER